MISRAAVCVVFRRYVLNGDESFLHHFVVLLAGGGLTDENLASLSSWYDYPVWLSRAFPFYYPLRVVFGAADISVLRVVNTILGSATLVLSFLIARRLIGSTYARCAAFLLTAFPLHIFEVLSFTPQIPGTLFVTMAVWLMLWIIDKESLSLSAVMSIGPLLGLVLLLAGVQRGGFDVLLIVSYPVLAALHSIRNGKRAISPALLVGLLALVTWWPAKHAFDAWIRAHDAHAIRSHVLGFMTRGSNPVSLGEYLLRYEQLDTASPVLEKQRVLVSVLATEVVREPLVTFGLVPAAKLGKFFALGYAPITEYGLASGGYIRAAQFSRALTIAYAPIVLFLCMFGLLTALNEPYFACQLSPLFLLIVLAAGAIVLVWESSPRYSHGVDFAILAIAALGFGSMRNGARGAIKLSAGAYRGIGLTVCAVLLLWVLLAVGLYVVAEHARTYLYLDMRNLIADMDGHPAELRALHRWTTSWERAITIPKGTSLPATLHLHLPMGEKGVRYSMSVWTSDPTIGEGASCVLIIPSVEGNAARSRLADLNSMRRGIWKTSSQRGLSIDLALLPPDGENSHILSKPLTWSIGYVLAER